MQYALLEGRSWWQNELQGRRGQSGWLALLGLKFAWQAKVQQVCDPLDNGQGPGEQVAIMHQAGFVAEAKTVHEARIRVGAALNIGSRCCQVLGWAMFESNNLIAA